MEKERLMLLSREIENICKQISQLMDDVADMVNPEDRIEIASYFILDTVDCVARTRAEALGVLTGAILTMQEEHLALQAARREWYMSDQTEQDEAELDAADPSRARPEYLRRYLARWEGNWAARNAKKAKAKNKARKAKAARAA